jgi:hypothetical protein
MIFIFTSNFLLLHRSLHVLHFHGFVRFLINGLSNSLANGYIRGDLFLFLSPDLAEPCTLQLVVNDFIGFPDGVSPIHAIKELPLLNLKEVVVEAPAAKLSSFFLVAMVSAVVCHQAVSVFSLEGAPKLAEVQRPVLRKVIWSVFAFSFLMSFPIIFRDESEADTARTPLTSTMDGKGDISICVIRFLRVTTLTATGCKFVQDGRLSIQIPCRAILPE